MNQREIAARIMSEFAGRTGLTSTSVPMTRYLWTDAFAVVNFLALGEIELAERLVGQVHATLGRHRADDVREGWISGLPEDEGRARPTAGGLRIGKPLPERAPTDAYDERLEWERDGQYFHYSTKWMHALIRVAEASRRSYYLRLAIDLALASHRGFVIGPGRKRMVWKASIDLSRPLVTSMGQHDPLDGLLTFVEVASAAVERGVDAVALDHPIEDMRVLCAGSDWTTLDPLGLGGLLLDAHRLARLLRAGFSIDPDLLPSLLRSIELGLTALPSTGALTGPAYRRLAFRELGLAIGLRAIPALTVRAADLPPHARPRLATLERSVLLADDLIAFWLAPPNQSTDTWRSHLDINAVMLASALVPEGVLGG